MDGYWYVVQVYTGHENKVKLGLENMVAREGIQNEILQVKVPLTEVVEVKDSKRKVSSRPSYPGYVLVNTMHELGLDVEAQIGQRSWDLIKGTTGVMGFLGPNSSPSALEVEEVERMLSMATLEEEQPPVPIIDYEVGDEVKVIDGPFSGFPAEIQGIDMERQRLNLSITIFGRSTPVELGFLEVERL